MLRKTFQNGDDDDDDEKQNVQSWTNYHAWSMLWHDFQTETQTLFV